jgi:hypothetical protein
MRRPPERRFVHNISGPDVVDVREELRTPFGIKSIKTRNQGRTLNEGDDLCDEAPGIDSIESLVVASSEVHWPVDASDRWGR